VRRAAKVDANHTEIVDALRLIGVSVASTAAIGKGFPDLVVSDGPRTLLIEIKDGEKSPSKRKLTEDQEKFAAAWRGQIAKVESVADALKLFGWRKTDV
jgi:Holliday junction resolvase